MTELQEPTFAPEARQAMGEKAPKQQDYFGFDRTEKYWLPDGVSYIEFKPMNEGKKKEFQDKTSSDLVYERSGNARMSVLQGSQRHELIRASVVGWNLAQAGEAVPFSNVMLTTWLNVADPILIEGLEKAIRKANPWLLAEMSSQDIQKEIDNLQEMKEVALKREAGEVG